MADSDPNDSNDDHQDDDDSDDDANWFVYHQGMQYRDIPEGVTRVRVQDGTREIQPNAFHNSYHQQPAGGLDDDDDDDVAPDNNKYDQLRQLQLAASLQVMGDDALAAVPHLHTIWIPPDSQLSDIGARALARLPSWRGDVTLPASLRRIGDSGLSGSNIRSFVVIGGGSDDDTSTNNSGMIPPSSQLESVGDGCFRFCTELISIDLGHCPRLTRLGVGTFSECTALESVVLPPNLARIGSAAFRDCSSLPAIDFPPTLRQIDDHCFGECSELKTLTIPASVRSIGEAAFQSCASLEWLELESVESLGAIVTALRPDHVPVFSGCTALHTLQWPQQEVPVALWPRAMVRLLGDEESVLVGRFYEAWNGNMNLNRITCWWTSILAHQELLDKFTTHQQNRRRAPPERNG